MTTFNNITDTLDFIVSKIKDIIDEHEYDINYIDDNTLEDATDHFMEELEEYFNYDYIDGVDINFNMFEIIKLMKLLNEMRLEYGNETFLDWDKLEEQGIEYLINHIIYFAYHDNKEVIKNYVREQVMEVRRTAEREAEDYLIDTITRAYHRGGEDEATRRMFTLLERTEVLHHDIIFGAAKEAFHRLGKTLNIKKITLEEYEEEQKFVEKFKKTTMGVINVMLERIDDKKQIIKEYEYMELLRHLKMAWELVEEVKSKERAVVVKDMVNTFWKKLAPL